MTAPYPIVALPGYTQSIAEAPANALFKHYCWLARWSDELTNDSGLDLKKVRQFVYHGNQYVLYYNQLQELDKSVAADGLERVFGFRDVKWETRQAMATDLSAIASGAETLVEWIEQNENRYKDGFTVAVEVDGQLSDTSIVIDEKPEAFQTKISAFRALFGTKPSLD